MMPTLSTGRWLGPYRILAPLGAGGGEVYGAHITRLGRTGILRRSPHWFHAESVCRGGQIAFPAVLDFSRLVNRSSAGWRVCFGAARTRDPGRRRAPEADPALALPAPGP